MSRLLHAAARGARIEVRYEKYWSSALAVRTVDDLLNYRIHPDDKHLQYGPVSTALREMSEDFVWNGDWACFLAGSIANEFTVYFDSRTGEPDYPLYYLFLAEFLADEGM